MFFGGVVAKVISRPPVTVEEGFFSRKMHVGFVMEKVTLGEGFLRVLLFLPQSIIPPAQIFNSSTTDAT